MARARSNVTPLRKPFRAVPLKRVARRPAPRRGRGVTPIMVMLPLAAFTAVFVWGGPPVAQGLDWGAPSTATRDRETARFGLCGAGARDTCVIDGDTFWYRGDKVRLADINTPEIGAPECAAEAALGARATARLQDLLNQGAFALEPVDRDRDAYGRLLRTVTRGGESLGDTLVSEGLAEPWQGYRRTWC